MREEAPNRTKMSQNPRIPSNLTSRVGKPALFAGRLQKAVERAFIAHNGPITTVEAGIWCYPRAERPDRSNVKRVLKRLGCVKLRRLGGSARPLLWAPPLI
jgi:hypothetical protein